MPARRLSPRLAAVVLLLAATGLASPADALPSTAASGTVVKGTVLNSASISGTAVPTTDPGPVVPGSTAPSETVGGAALGSRGLVVHYRPGAAPLPPVAARAWVLADATTGQVLAAKNAHDQLRPASTLKTLTALTLLPRLDPAMVYTARDTDTHAEGSHVGIVSGATYTVADLWNGLLLPSGNDAASALANAYGGVGPTVTAMNAEAARLQARDTHAVNPSGLDADGQYTSAYDLALIARAGLALPAFADHAKKVSADFPGKPARPGKPRRTFKIYTQNRLLLSGYKGAIGIKTGWTTLAHRTFVGAVSRGGRTYVAALMVIGSASHLAAESLFDWAFAHADQVDPVGVLVDPLPAGPTPGPTADAGHDSGGTAPVAAAGVVASPAGSEPWRTGLSWLLVTVAVVGTLAVGLRARVLLRRRRNPGPR